MNIKLHGAGLSLFTGQATVYDGNGNQVAAAAATDPLNNDVSIHLSSVQSTSTYYVKVQSARTDVFGIGAYKLTVDLNPGGAVFGQNPFGKTQVLQAPGGAGRRRTAAAGLQPLRADLVAAHRPRSDRPDRPAHQLAADLHDHDDHDDRDDRERDHRRCANGHRLDGIDDGPSDRHHHDLHDDDGRRHDHGRDHRRHLVHYDHRHGLHGNDVEPDDRRDDDHNLGGA